MFKIWFADYTMFTYTPMSDGKMSEKDSKELEEMIKKHGRIINIGFMVGF